MDTIEDVGPFDVICGLDVGKATHHAYAITQTGEVVVNESVGNDETQLRRLLTRVAEHGAVVLVVDQLAAIGALPVAVARRCGIEVGYLPGLSMRRLADVHPGSAKTDAIDARVIAQAGRSLPHLLRRIDVGDPELAPLEVLVGYDQDLAVQVNREANRIRDALTHVHPALERAVGPHITRPGVLALLVKAPTPNALRKLGAARMAKAVEQGGSPRLANTLPAKIVTALGEQTLVLPATDSFATVIAGSATRLISVLADRKDLAKQTDALLEAHPLGQVLITVPGIGTRTAAMILAVVPDITAFPSAAALASYSGLAPVSRRSGTSVRADHTPVRGHRQLKKALFQSAFASLADPLSRAYYDRKRAEGKHHNAALICLARRRINVIYAIMRDSVPYQQPNQEKPPQAA